MLRRSLLLLTTATLRLSAVAARNPIEADPWNHFKMAGKPNTNDDWDQVHTLYQLVQQEKVARLRDGLHRDSSAVNQARALANDQSSYSNSSNEVLVIPVSDFDVTVNKPASCSDRLTCSTSTFTVVFANLGTHNCSWLFDQDPANRVRYRERNSQDEVYEWVSPNITAVPNKGTLAPCELGIVKVRFSPPSFSWPACLPVCLRLHRCLRF
jgi:hypothetical protein